MLQVGGTVSSTIIDHMREHGRILICGSISTYNDKEGEKHKEGDYCVYTKVYQYSL